MGRRRTPTPRFNLAAHNAKEKDKAILILLVLRYNGNLLRWSTKEKIAPRFWDTNRNRAKITVNNPSDSYINTCLNDYANKALEIYRRFDGEISVDDFKNELDIAAGRKRRQEVDAPNFMPLLEFIDYYIELRRDAHNAKRGTWKILQTCGNHLKSFAQERRAGKLDYEDVDWNFRHDFEQWLYHPPREHSNNYAGKVLSIVKQFMSEAYERGYHKNEIFKRRNWNIKKERFSKQVLSFEELDKLNELDLSDNPRLDKVRDLFLIGAFSGLRFSDFTRIRPQHIVSEDGQQLIELFSKKTNTQVVIPLLPILRAKLEKYDFTPPKISSQKFNEYIKEVCRVAGIDQEILVKRSKAGKRIEEVRPKYELITSHTARRSFATNFFQLGLPAISLMRVTGHATERQFMEYINVDKRANARSMAAKVAKLMGQTPLRKVE